MMMLLKRNKKLNITSTTKAGHPTTELKKKYIICDSCCNNWICDIMTCGALNSRLKATCKTPIDTIDDLYMTTDLPSQKNENIYKNNLDSFPRKGDLKIFDQLKHHTSVISRKNLNRIQ